MSEKSKLSWRGAAPGLAAGVFLFGLAAGIALPQLQTLALASGESFLHVRFGNEILEHLALPHVDTFSSTRAGAPYVAHEWAFQILISLFYRVCGIDGFVLIAALFSAGALAVVASQMRRQGVGPLAAAVTLAASLPALAIGYRARPQLMSGLLFAALLALLPSAAWRRWTTARRSAAMFAFIWFWACFHPGALLGVVVLALALGIETAAGAGPFRPRAKDAVIVAASATAALFVTPYGFDLARTITTMLAHPSLLQKASEWTSLSPVSWPAASVVLLAVLAVMAYAGDVREHHDHSPSPDGKTCGLHAPLFGVVVVLFAASWTGRRLTPFFALAALPAAAVTVEGWARRLRLFARGPTGQTSKPRDPPPETTAGLSLPRTKTTAIWIASSTAAACATLAATHGRVSDAVYRNGSRQPVAAVEFARSHLSELGAVMYNNHNFGSYLTLTLPERKVFIDGRDELYGLEFLEEQLAIVNGDPEGPRKLAKWGVDWAIFFNGSPLASRLIAAKWKLVFADPVAVILVRPLH